MARAKRTSSERAAARRRFRAATDAEILEDEAGSSADAPDRAAPSARPNAGAIRMGIIAALRASFHPVRVREDLAALPSLVTNKALWLPVLVTVVSTIAVVATGGRDVITAFLFAYFVQSPAIGGVFIAGFLAPRASWLLGAIVGVVAAIGYVAVLTMIPGALTPTGPGSTAIQEIAVSAFLLSPVMGAFFASAAAWYRRFLTLTNPNRGRRAQQPQKRVGDGRTRGSAPKANAKAPARR